MSTWAIVVGAGDGRRFGEPEGLPKVLRPVHGTPMFLHALRLFDSHPSIDGTVFVFPAIWEGQILEEIAEQVTGPVHLAVGGSSRGASVRSGLREVPDEATAILVHDAARPIVDAPLVDRVLAGLDRAPAVVCGIPATDTLKRTKDGVVEETIQRADVVHVQTPQAFRAEEFRAVHGRAAADGAEATDDAGLFEVAGLQVVVVPGDEKNVKVTTQADLLIAEAFLRDREGR